MILNTSQRENRGLVVAYTEVMQIGVKTSGILENCVRCVGGNLSPATVVVSLRRSLQMSLTDKNVAAMTLLSLYKN